MYHNTPIYHRFGSTGSVQNEEDRVYINNVQSNVFGIELVYTMIITYRQGDNPNLYVSYSPLAGADDYKWGFYKSWSTYRPTQPDLAGRNCPLSAMGVKVSLVCSNSIVFLRIDIFSQYGEVINSINPREHLCTIDLDHHWPR